MIGIKNTHDACDIEAPVATLGHVLGVFEILHEVVTYLCVLRESETWLGDPLAEPEIGKTGSYYMKCWAAIASFEQGQ